MRLTEETIKKIDKHTTAIMNEQHKTIWCDNVSIQNVPSAKICINNVAITDIENLNTLIERLTVAKEAIERATGIIID